MLNDREAVASGGFEQFFQRAEGRAPFGYQVRLARDGLPAVVAAPDGKTGVILVWLWRMVYGTPPGTGPRRLIYALPHGSLVEAVGARVEGWLGALGLAERVSLHTVMSGAGEARRQWRIDPHRPAIVLGTADTLVSKALNRGHGLSRAMYPIDFALVTNGAHWIVDEPRLCPAAAGTLLELAAFTDPGRPGSWPTAEPFAVTCVSSAPIAADRAGAPAAPIAADRAGTPAARLDGTRTVRRLPVDPGDHAALATAVRQRHRPGSHTLVVLNTVAAARAVLAALDRAGQPAVLLHDRFRGVDLLGQVDAADRIIVATGAVEAGIDLDAAVVVMEAAAWPSVVLRAAHCNRSGGIGDAELWWLPPPSAPGDVRASVAELTALDGAPVTGDDLWARPVPVTPPVVPTLRRADLLAVFDTSPDIDVTPHLSDSAVFDVQVAWAQWTPVDASGRPAAEVRMPEQRWRCPVPSDALRTLAARATVWWFDHADGRWSPLTERDAVRPGEMLLVAAHDGGYDPRAGLDVRDPRPVAPAPVIDPVPRVGVGVDGPERWLSLEQHSADVRDQVRALLAVLDPALPAAAAPAAVLAGHAHDLGKAYPTWQDALCALAGDPEPAWITAGRPWAKSGIDAPLRFRDDVAFRHELASLLLLDGPLRGLLAGVEDPDLVRYLVLAHHGMLRLRVQGTDDTSILGLTQGDTVQVPALLGEPVGNLTVDLSPFVAGESSAWTRTASGLRDRYGPFVLAYLEMLVRIADWRASAGLPPAG